MTEYNFRQLHESNVTCELYHQLKLIGIPCVAEYKIQNSRCDMVIHNETNITHIIEIKHRRVKAINFGIRQFKRYNMICRERNIPFIVLTRFENVTTLVNDLRNNVITECKPYIY